MTGLADPEKTIGWRRMGVVTCCLLLTMIDGFDTQSIGFAGPAIIKDWNLPPAALGPIFSAGLFGALIGAIILGAAADRFGRIQALTVSVFLFSVGTMATAFVSSEAALLAVRFFTGIGLGGALPSLLAIPADQLPAHRRSTGISLVLMGVPLGASIGGFGSVWVIEAYGWQGMFALAGLAPLPVLAALLALSRGSSSDRHGGPISAPPAPDSRGIGLAEILSPRYRGATIMLWASGFFAVMLTYTLTSWLPTLLTERGFSMHDAVLATALFNFGSIFGGLAVGRLSDMRGPFAVIVLAYIAGAIAIAAIGASTIIGAALISITAAGLFAIGGQAGIGILSATIYDASLRARSVGFTLAVGRLGAVFGPLVIGAMLARGTTIPQLFLVGAGVALTVALLMSVMAYVSRRARAVD